MSDEENVSEEISEEEDPGKKPEQVSPPLKKRKTSKKDDGDNNKEKPKKGKRKKPSHPKTLDMIVEALENLEDNKGSSVQSIKSFIIDHFKVRPDMIKSMMRRALLTGLQDGTLCRPKNQVDTKQTLAGRYLIKKKKETDAEPPPVRTRPPSLRQPKPLKKGKSKKKKRKKGFY